MERLRRLRSDCAAADGFVPILGSVAVSAYALAAGWVVYTLTKRITSIRLTDEQQPRGADLAIHSIGATPDEF